MSTAKARVKLSEIKLVADRMIVLKTALDQGKPSSVKAIKREIERLDFKRKRLIRQRELILHRAKKAMVVEDQVIRAKSERKLRVTMLEDQIAIMAKQATLLSEMVKGIKLMPRDTDEGPTPEMVARPTARDPIATLEFKGHLERHQVMAARMIARICEAISRAGRAKVGKLERSIGGTGVGGGDMPEELDDLRHHVYLPWVRSQPKDQLFIVDKVAVRGLAIDRVRRHKRLGWKKAMEYLQAGLDAFAKAEKDWQKAVEQRPDPSEMMRQEPSLTTAS